MEKKTREHTIQIEGLRDRIIVLAILGLLGGPGVVKILIPQLGHDPETLRELEQLKGQVKNISEDLMHEIDILDAKIDETRDDCLTYAGRDRDEMESLRHKTGKLELLINQCLERTR